jgi:tRNA pseudouridine38-40 synthase
MRFALIVEYDGTGYHGYQYQPGVPTVQLELEKAIESLTGEKLRVAAAGRTDTGVHALGQVVAFDTESGHGARTIVNAMNFYLPDDVVVRSAYHVRDGFDPRRDATSRWYRYTIHNGERPSAMLRNLCCHVPEPLEVDAMAQAAKGFVGTHDFDRFCGPLPEGKTNTTRTVFKASVRRDGEMVTFDVEANAFLPHQVRRMAGALVDVGRGRLAQEDIRKLIELESTQAVAHSMAARGLCLMEVRYRDFPPRNGEGNGEQR